MANGELQSLVNFRQPANSTLRAAPYRLVLSDSPFYVDFRTLIGSDLDGTPFKPYGIYIDNTQGNANLIILFQDTQFRVVCKKGEVLHTSYPAADYAIAAITGNGPASIIFVDYSVEPYSSDLTGGSAMAIWGAITGNIAAQADLQTQFDTKVDKVPGFGLSQNSFTNANATKLNGIETGAQVNAVTSVAGRVGAITLSKIDVDLSNVDNTSDANKPVSTAQQTALNQKWQKNAGGPTFIIGMEPTWISASSISFNPGSLYVPSLSDVMVCPTLAITGFSGTANTWYYAYAYSIGGVPSIEINTTVPVVYSGKARIKSGDNSRRFIGAFRTNASGGFTNFICAVTGMICYRENISAAPFRILAAGTANTPTAVSASAVVPLTTQSCRVAVTNASTTNGGAVSNPDALSIGLITAGGGAKAYADFFTDSAQALSYSFPTTPTSSGMFIDVTAYGNDR